MDWLVGFKNFLWGTQGGQPNQAKTKTSTKKHAAFTAKIASVFGTLKTWLKRETENTNPKPNLQNRVSISNTKTSPLPSTEITPKTRGLQKLKELFGPNVRFVERDDGYVLLEPGGGSCMFHSVADALRTVNPDRLPQEVQKLLEKKDKNNLTSLLRSEAVSYIKRNKNNEDLAIQVQVAIDDYNNVYPARKIETIDDYLENAAKKDFFASGAELLGLAHYLGLNIEVRVEESYNQRIPDEQKDADIILVLHGQHYDALIPKVPSGDLANP